MRISDWSSDVCSSDLSVSSKAFGCATASTIGSTVSTVASTTSTTTPVTVGTRPDGPSVLSTTASTTGGRTASTIGNTDRKSVVEGKSVSDRVDLGGRRILQKKTNKKKHTKQQ